MPSKIKKNKSTSKVNYANSLFFLILVVCSCLSAGYLWNIKSEKSQKPSLSQTNPKTIYPSQYSDKNITQNAIASDPQYKFIAFNENQSMLANTISSVNNNTNTSNEMEMGTWLWTPVLDQTPKYRKSIISGALKNGIKNIYLSIDSYLDIYIMPDGEEKTKKRQAFDKNVEDFIREANQNGITVDAEAGWRNWAEDGNTYKALATINYAKRFNKNHDVKFRNFQYDVEPYLLDSYQQNKEKTLTNFLDLIDSSVSFLSNSDLKISVVIPEFYDGSNGETPRFNYKGKNGYATEHLLSILDKRDGSSIIIMAYRNFAKGTDGTIDVSSNEILSANNHKTKIIIAQETGNVEPPYITFFNTNKKYYKKQENEIKKTFSNNKSYGGLAIHYINAFMELK